MEKEVSERSTKKDLWEAYQRVVEAKEASLADILNASHDGEEGSEPSSKKKISVGKQADISSEAVAALLEDLRRIVTDATGRFRDDMALYQKQAQQEKEELHAGILRTRGEWQREQEEYVYRSKLERRKEEDEYAIRVRDKERQFSEKYVAKEKELTEREQKIKVGEEEMRQAQTRIVAFPKELEKAVHDAEDKICKEMEQRAKIAVDLAAKDREREQEVAGLKIKNLEDIIKLRSAHITSLEQQLAQANQQIQKLAVTVVESGSNALSKRNFQEQEKQESKPMG